MYSAGPLMGQKEEPPRPFGEANRELCDMEGGVAL
jgi:hypothetical protein